MRAQTLARELALKALYQHDLLGELPEGKLRAFCHENARPEVAEVALQLVEGCLAHQDALDEIIRQTAENWELERMATSDRNILRLGVYELLFRRETPPKVAINEAIELAKKYSTENSPTFVNGVLDRIYTERPAQDPGEAATSDCESRSLESAAAGGGVALLERADPEARVDLHVHSTASDGSVDPADLPVLAAKAGLSAFALTDHDSLEGIRAASEAAEEIGMLLVPGVELTGYAPSPDGEGDLEVHVAGVLVDAGSPVLLDRLRQLRTARVQRVEQMSRKLQEVGVPIESESVLRRSDGGSVGRLHVAQELIERGHCASVSDAFERYIGLGRPGYVAKVKMTPGEAIALIQAAGGCSVLCHPGLTPGIEAYMDELVEQGLDALEVHYPWHTPQDEKKFMDMARRLGLVVSGGSDFHGDAKPDIHIGREAVSLVELNELRRRAQVRA
ncbi:MAG: transcription antitermination factor NusB [Planctomycetota bacterium]